MNHMKLQGALVLALWAGLATLAHASPQLATEYGCLNCHGAHSRGDAPKFERLTEKLAKYKGDDAEQAKFVTKYRTGEAFEHIDAHERLSVDAATALVHWLAEGGK